MFGDEEVVRDIGIKGANDVVAILVGVVDGIVKLVTVGLGVAHQVEPMTSPSFTEVWRGKEAVYRGFDGGIDIAGGGFFEFVDFLRSRRKAGEVEGQASQKS